MLIWWAAEAAFQSLRAVRLAPLAGYFGGIRDGGSVPVVPSNRVNQPPFVSRMALKLGVVLVMLGFQVNLLAADNLVLYLFFYYAALLGCFVVTLGGRISYSFLLLLCVPMVLTTLVGNPLKGFGLGVGACLGYIAVSRYERDYRTAMSWLLAVNIAVAVIQFLGVWEESYRFTYYRNDAIPIPVTDERFGQPNFLPQIRPSGIFPSPTYVSAFTVLLFSTVLATVRGTGRLIALWAGVFFTLVGSTVGLVLAGLSLPLAVGIKPLRYLVLGYVVSTVLYAIYLPQQFDYNFNARELVASVVSRLDLVEGSGEGVMQNNWPLFVLLIVAGVVFMLVAGRFGFAALLLPPGIALALPVMVHDLTLSMFYWFLLGAVAARILTDGELRRLARSIRQRRARSRLGGNIGQLRSRPTHHRAVD